MRGHSVSTFRRLAALALLTSVVGVVTPSRADGDANDATTVDAWNAVAVGDAVVLMRHALAPGTGDPAGFDIEDCATQRNLSEAGREQAREIGEHIADALGTREVAVSSSAWCCCLVTAWLLGLGSVERLPSLDSFFRRRERQEEQTRALEHWTARRVAASVTTAAVLVTHQVNITALADVFPTSGEIVIVDDRARVLARVPEPDAP